MTFSKVWRSRRVMLLFVFASLSLVSSQATTTTDAGTTTASSSLAQASSTASGAAVSSTVAQGIVSTTLAAASSSTTDSSSASSSSSTTTTTQTSPVTHTISAGEGGFSFSPDVVQANVGDFIEWDFYPANHSVVRAAYRFPCIPYEDTGVDRAGFFSGFKPVDAILSKPPTYTIRINDTEPIFYYCSATDACNKQGMVGVINPNATTSLQTQQDLALNSSFQLQPGESFPTEQEASSSTTASSGTPTSTDQASTTSSAKHHSSTQSLSSGAIAGIAIGASAVALGAAALLYLCGRNSRRAVTPNPEAYDARASFLPAHQKRASDMSFASTGLGSDRGQYQHPLPGYMPQNDTEMTPALRSQYSHEAMTARSPSPGQMMGGTPAYAMPLLGQQHSQQTHELEAPHEMYAPTEPAENLAPKPIRHNSMWKGTVERYG